MRTIPIDSTDAREQRELEAEQERAEARAGAAAARGVRRALALSLLDDARHSVRCVDGWLGEDDDGRPIPCTRCRPWLAHVPCRTCGTSYGACPTTARSACCEDCNHDRLP